MIYSSSVLPIIPIGSIWNRTQMRQWRNNTPVTHITIERNCFGIIAVILHRRITYMLFAITMFNWNDTMTQVNCDGQYTQYYWKAVALMLISMASGGGFLYLSIQSLQTKKQPSLILLQDAFHFKEVSRELSARSTLDSRGCCLLSSYHSTVLFFEW